MCPGLREDSYWPTCVVVARQRDHRLYGQNDNHTHTVELQEMQESVVRSQQSLINLY